MIELIIILFLGIWLTRLGLRLGRAATETPPPQACERVATFKIGRN